MLQKGSMAHRKFRWGAIVDPIDRKAYLASFAVLPLVGSVMPICEYCDMTGSGHDPRAVCGSLQS